MQVEHIPNPLLKRALLTPERTAVSFNGVQYTFKELYDLAHKTAGQLARHGVRKGRFAAVLLGNHMDTIVILLALQLLGAKTVMINNRLTAGEIAWQLRDSGACVLLTGEKFREKIASLRKELPSFSVVTKEVLFQTPMSEPEIVEEVALDDVCSVMYTSGTTGAPKGVLQTYGNHWWSAVGSALNLGLREDDCWLCAVPVFHISGYSILMRSLFYGMKMVLHERFDEKKTIEDISVEKVTIMSVVTTMLARIVDQLKDGKLPGSFRCMLLGGGPAPLSLLEKCIQKDIPVYQSYGMTETASQIVTLSPEYSVKKLGSAGKPLFPASVKVVDDAGKEAAPYQSGEILVKGPNVAKGYLNYDPSYGRWNGWFRTGDIGFLDEEGFLYVQDRRSDLIISGGENIYPAEVEEALMSHPRVKDAGVIGVEDPEWGQVPVAFVVKEGSVSADELFKFVQSKLAKYKVPKEIYFVGELPRNASRKLLRRKLREMLEKGEEDLLRPAGE